MDTSLRRGIILVKEVLDNNFIVLQAKDRRTTLHILGRARDNHLDSLNLRRRR